MRAGDVGLYRRRWRHGRATECLLRLQRGMHVAMQGRVKRLADANGEPPSEAPPSLPDPAKPRRNLVGEDRHLGILPGVRR